MPTCSFCNGSFHAKGKMLVLNSGKILRFCSSKCEKNMLKLKRVPRKVTWVRKKKKGE
ncbi:50S ribosomal protein L24e [Candidatus Woesearchaeota archaeon]|nr:50S ribosomal protein L24e [Candidatus Woesearchaeota archaeon]